MLAAHDAAALEALASAGAVRRAVRDVEEGKVRVVSRDDGSAVVEAGGQRVEIGVEGPRAARCGCPATGLCRHVLAAVLALRAEVPGDAPAPVSAREEVLALDVTEMTRFAGADLAAAQALAAEAGEGAVTEDGARLEVRVVAGAEPVVFIAGQGLKGAVWKGPARRLRLMVAAAALLVRGAAGMALPEVEAPEAGLDAEYLDGAAEAVEVALRRVLTGTPGIAAELLFDQAVSARAQAAPRLTSALRGLSAQAALAEAHHAGFDEAEFLTGAARAAALIAALKAAPGDVALTGEVRRTYVAGTARRLWIAGARVWRSEQGARGLRLYGLDLERGTWLSGGPARGAGMDLQFSPAQAYQMPVWGAAPARDVVGRVLDFAAMEVSRDGLVAPSARASVSDDGLSHARLREIGAVHDDWTGLLGDLAARMRGGLGDGGLPCPVLVAPAEVGRPVFDAPGQCYLVPLRDTAGRVLNLSVEGGAPEQAAWLHRHAGRGDVILCEAAYGAERLCLTPVSVCRDGKTRVTVTSLSLDKLEGGRGLADLIEKLGLSRMRGAAVSPPDPVADLAGRMIDAAVTRLAVGGTEALDALAPRADRMGLARLARAARAAAPGGADAILRLAYLADEVRRGAQLSPPAG